MKAYKEWVAQNSELGSVIIKIKEITGKDIRDPDLIKGFEAAAQASGDKFFDFIKSITKANPISELPDVQASPVNVRVPTLGGWRERGQGSSGPNGS